MNLAAILAVSFLSLGWLPPSVPALAARPVGQNAAPSEPKAAPPQSPDSTPAAPPPTGQTQNSTGPAKPPVAKPHHHKKAVPSNCSTAPTALNPAVGNPADTTNSAGAGSTEAGSAASANAVAANPDSTSAGSANAGPAASKPCPPPKKIVRNGGSPEPTVQLTGGTTAEQAAHQRSTDQLTAATEENLKKIVGRQLSSSQQEMVTQIKQFMAQSKIAVAAGDLERGHNLAMKAHLLSEELVKP
jgi:hypothetical protein